jgi:hypothetical protein
MSAKKKEMPVREFLQDHTLEEAVKEIDGAVAEHDLLLASDPDAPPPLHVVGPQPKPGDADFDWQTEYPDELFYVYTVPETAKKSPQGRQSPIGLTIGLAGLSEDRAPNPGEMQEADERGGFAPMWLFLRCVTSPTAMKLTKLLRPTEYNEMLRGWADFAGIELSE